VILKQENGVISTSRVPLDIQAIFDFTQLVQEVCCWFSPVKTIAFNAIVCLKMVSWIAHIKAFAFMRRLTPILLESTCILQIYTFTKAFLTVHKYISLQWRIDRK
jgi:hypothetical protein